MMGSHCVLAENRGKMMAHALREPPGVNKNQRGTICEHEIGDALVNLFPHLVRSHGPKLAGRNFDRQIQMAPLRNLDDCRTGPLVSGQKMCDQFDGLLCGGETDAR